MTVWAYKRGHKVCWNAQLEEWCYADNGRIADHDRPCVQCGEMPTGEGHDACLGYIPGVAAACCGHGVEDGMILWQNRPDGYRITIEQIGDVVRWLRKRHGKKLREVAEAAGMSVSFLSDLEHGRTMPSLASLEALAHAFGVKLAVIFGQDHQDVD